MRFWISLCKILYYPLQYFVLPCVRFCITLHSSTRITRLPWLSSYFSWATCFITNCSSLSWRKCTSHPIVNLPKAPKCDHLTKATSSHLWNRGHLCFFITFMNHDNHYCSYHHVYHGMLSPCLGWQCWGGSPPRWLLPLSPSPLFGNLILICALWHPHRDRGTDRQTGRAQIEIIRTKHRRRNPPRPPPLWVDPSL